jgi:hypothetical protein
MEGIVLGLVVEVSRNEENDCSSSQTMETIGLRLASLLVLPEFGSSFLPSSPLFSIAPPANECARPLPPDRILKTSSGRRTWVYRDCTLEMEVSQEECVALKTQNTCQPQGPLVLATAAKQEQH